MRLLSETSTITEQKIKTKTVYVQVEKELPIASKIQNELGKNPSVLVLVRFGSVQWQPIDVKHK